MENKEMSKKLTCSICGQRVLKNPNISGKPYAVRLSEPIVCDMCSQHLANVDDENQSRLQARNYSALINKSSKHKPNVVKPEVEIVNKPHEIELNEIISTVKSVVKGQDEHVEVISTAIYQNYKSSSPEIKSNLIILGESGSGKTEIIKILAEQFKLPYVIEDATRFTEAGYTGANIDDMIKNLYMAAGDNIIKAQKGILVIDEGDKKGSVGDGGRDVSGENVLFSLLKILEGSKVPITTSYGDTLGTLDTSTITVIFIGSFPKLVEIREKRLKQTGIIGFNSQKTVNEVINSEYIPSDFMEGGFPKEFIGRFDIIVELNTLIIDNFEDIVMNSKKSTFVNYVKELGNEGITLVYSEDVIKEIALESEKLKIGARGIKKVVKNMFKNIMFEILSNKDKYTKCYINENTVHDSTDYVLV